MATRHFFQSGVEREQTLPRCMRCQTRWPQTGRAGLCQRCWRELNYVTLVDRTDTAAVIAFEQQLEAAVDALPPPKREVTIDGQTFEVVWDGR